VEAVAGGSLVLSWIILGLAVIFAIFSLSSNVILVSLLVVAIGFVAWVGLRLLPELLLAVIRTEQNTAMILESVGTTEVLRRAELPGNADAALICPKCHTTYREGFDTCADCHVPLEALPSGRTDGAGGGQGEAAGSWHR
ncbi:MAG: hypothetical protein M0Z27_04225, partial [Thermaerobacter sp.]|nr:hypothetical protein [Thermaerobacter sp.]